jgi:hypothetical protein
MNQNLQLTVPNEGSVDATMLLRWALRPHLAVELIRHKAKKPVAIFQIVTRTEEEGRYEGNGSERLMVPLDQLQNYFWFRRAGDHIIKISIAWKDSGEITRKVRKKFFEKDSDGDFANSLGRVFDHVIFCEEIEVHVSEKFFAKEPIQWLWNFANFPYETPPRDQCHFRRRALLSPLANLSLVLMLTVVGLVKELLNIAHVLGLIIQGRRGIDFSVLRHPFITNIGDAARFAGASIFLNDSRGDKRKGFIPLLYPPRIVILLMASFVASTMSVYSFWSVFVTMSLAMLSLIGLFAVLDYREQKAQAREQEKEEEPASAASLLALTYSPNKNGGALPQGRRTFALAYQELKVSLCRPYASR